MRSKCCNSEAICQKTNKHHWYECQKCHEVCNATENHPDHICGYNDGFDCKCYGEGYEDGRKERIEHCGVKDCPECNLKAYNTGFEAGKKMKGSSWREGYIKGREDLLADIMRLEQGEALESQGEDLTKE